jgi:acetoacetyl-CoA reductase/3-oxoacyl-[acyl-carrier protein] reductase
MTDPLAVVTGGTRGIGLAFSRRLVSLGHRVVAWYAGDQRAAELAEKELGPAFAAMRVDVGDFDAVEAATAAVVAGYGPPRTVVNNAGINIDRPLLQMSWDDWRRVIDVNLSGAFAVCRSFAPHLLEHPDAVIVNVGATTGIRPRANGANYCASKAGLLQLTKCLAIELAPRVRVNCLIPGMTETGELVTRFRLDDPAARAAVTAEIPQRRIGQTDDIADALAFLVGPESRYMTGQKLIIDGGQFMW